MRQRPFTSTRCSMECRARLAPVVRLRSNAVVGTAVCGGAPGRRSGGAWGIHFASGPASSDDDELERSPPSRRWCRAAYARLIRLAGSLSGVDLASCGPARLAATGSLVTDACAAARGVEFDALAGKLVASQGQRPPPPLRSTPLSSLTRVCDVLGVSAQRRKILRHTICPQVTQHHIWRGALEEVLRDLQVDIASLDRPSPATQMAEQIASACTSFLSGTADAATSSSPSWMRPTPFKKPAAPPPPTKTWQEVLDMFTDLAKSLDADPRLAGHSQKVQAMKEGLYQIRDVVIERGIAFKEARRQDCLVQRKLTKSLGHSSRCLYTLLLFYLHGTVQDLEVHIGKHLSGKGDKDVSVHAAKFLISGEESTVGDGVKQLSRAISIFRFVWEAANAESGTDNDNGKTVAVKKHKGEDLKGVLKLQGHLWGFSVNETTITYRGDVFHVHQIQLL